MIGGERRPERFAVRSEKSRATLRCAVYTRVSTEHGLEQEFNSLDNQREASEAYVKSQTHEGWKLIRNRYDDGGYSGGSMERPALKRLLDDIRARRNSVCRVRFEIGMAGGEATRVSANSGVYDSAAERMRLIGDVSAAAITAEFDFGQGAGQSRLGAPALQEKTGFQSEREHVCGRPRALRRCG